MKIVNLFIIVFFCNTLWANQSPWHACKDSNAPQVNNIRVNEALQLVRQTFLDRFDLSQSEFNHTYLCLNNKENMTEDCINKRNYFFKQLPLLWKKYRKTLALTRFSINTVLGHKRGYSFNYKLRPPHMFWPVQNKIEVLSVSELENIEKRWQKISRIIIKKQIQNIKDYQERMQKKGVMLSRAGRDALFLLERDNLSLGSIYGLQQNTWIAKTLYQFEKLIFKINQKRLIEQLGKHPILAYLTSEKVNQKKIMRAIKEMQSNQGEQRTLILGELDTLIQERSPSTTDLYPYLDYVMIMEDILLEKPELCQIFTDHHRSYMRRELVKAGLTFIVFGTIAIYAKPMTSMAVISGYQVYMIYNALQESKQSLAQATINPQGNMGDLSGLNIVPFSEAYIKSDDFGTEIIISPLLITTAPLLRFTRVLNFLKVAK